jgi:hypothetical protein
LPLAMSASQFIAPLLKCARHSMLPNKFGNHNIVREECQQKSGKLKVGKSALSLKSPCPCDTL